MWLRLFQFRLATLLIAVTALCVWLGIQVNRANRQRRSVAAILAAGGLVRYDFQEQNSLSGKPIADAQPPGPRWLRKLIGDDYFCSVSTVDFATEFWGERRERELSKIDDDGLACLASLTKIRSLELGNNKAITDAGLAHLRKLKELESLWLYRSSVSGVGLNQLSKLPRLRNLGLQWTPLTTEGMQQLGTLKELRSLSLTDTPITDDDLMSLRSLTHLESLQLHRTAITDRGLPHLEALTALKRLTLPAEGVSEDGLVRLRLALPDCQMGRTDLSGRRP
jgi:hypothetical protein